MPIKRRFAILGFGSRGTRGEETPGYFVTEAARVATEADPGVLGFRFVGQRQGHWRQGLDVVQYPRGFGLGCGRVLARVGQLIVQALDRSWGRLRAFQGLRLGLQLVDEALGLGLLGQCPLVLPLPGLQCLRRAPGVLRSSRGAACDGTSLKTPDILASRVLVLRKIPGQRIVVSLRDRVELVVVAAGAADSKSEEGSAQGCRADCR